jgi:K+-sensing histidine kinase KdpD
VFISLTGSSKTIWAKNNVTEGASFYIELPIEKSDLTKKSVRIL